MKQEFAIKLAEALRSGNYKQGHGRLCSVFSQENDSKYCCLGVACEIAGIQSQRAHDSYGIDHSYYLEYDKHSSTLSPSAMDATGFQSSTGWIQEGGPRLKHGKQSFIALAHANDRGVPFSVIADYIEKNWEYL